MNIIPTIRVSQKVLEFPTWMPTIQSVEFTSIPEDILFKIAAVTPFADFNFTVTTNEFRSKNILGVKYSGKQTSGQNLKDRDIKVTIKNEAGAIIDTIILKVKLTEADCSGPCITECEICNFQFNEKERTPRVLDCGHTFCEECIMKIEVKPAEGAPANKSPTISCPNDRMITVRDRVDLLAKNRAIIDLVREKVEKDQQEKKRHVIDPYVPCFENNAHESKLYCESCEEAFCESCFKSVHASKALARHVSIPVKDKPVVTPKCPKHPENRATYVCLEEKCKNHKEYYCAKCEKPHHKGHSRRRSTTMFENNLNELKKVAGKFDEVDIEFRSQLTELRKCISSFAPGHPDSKNAIDLINDTYEKKKLAAISRYVAFAVHRTEELKVETEKVEEKNAIFKRNARKLQQMIRRKDELGEIKDVVKKSEEVLAVGPPLKKYHHSACDYIIDGEMVNDPALKRPPKIEDVDNVDDVELIAEEVNANGVIADNAGANEAIDATGTATGSQ